MPSLTRCSRPQLHFLTALLVLGSAGLWPVMGQTNLPKSDLPANRYLLIVQTSRSVQRRAGGMVNAVANLLGSEMNGQMHPGDSLGVWTFADDLYTGRFPLQRWSLLNRRPITERVMTFLNEQTYEKQASFDKVFPAINQLVKESPFITVILVTDGQDRIRGTPFDSPINDTFNTWRERQQAAQMPFLTVLRGTQGKLTHFSVNPAPWPVEMPPLPPELQLVKTATQEITPAPKAPASIVPSLVFRGKKPEASNVEAPVAVPASTNREAGPKVAATRSVAPLQPDASNAPVLLAKAEPLAYRVPQVVPSPKPVPTPSAAIAAETPPPARDSVAKPPTAVQNAVAVPPQASANRIGIWIAALVLTAALVGLGLLLVRRARPAPTASLITRSLERENK